MISFLLDTLLATGALIVLVMALRKAAARAFGPQMAYALWLLPVLRFAMPPILLPAALAPVAEAPAALVTAPPETVIHLSVPVSGASGEFAAAQPVASPALPWTELLLALWLGGAAAFLVWRFITYRRMRRHLLAEARPVGEVGAIRLVETPAVPGPVAFGVLDKVVALPIGFMAIEDRAARDLAIAHELAHHKGRDLAANILAQPLLALHWFNPVAWLAWRAMRRDQEAACDARVLAMRDRGERARYAEVIASFAAGPRLALAAPMACPMRAEKSIIHRLRSLKMADVSRRRRLLGRSLLVAGGLALPLTATISYAQAEAPEAPRAPAAPEAPEAPLAPDGPVLHRMVVVDIEGGADPDDPSLHTRTVESDGRTIVLKTDRELSDAEARERVERALRTMPRIDVAVAPPAPPAPTAPPAPAGRFEWSEEQEAAFEKQWEDWGEQMEKWGEEFGKAHAAQAEAHARQVEVLARVAPEVVESCAGEPATVTRHERTSDGRQRIVICQRVAKRQALAGLRNARNTIARDRNIDPDVRDDVLDDLDSEIERIESDS